MTQPRLIKIVLWILGATSLLNGIAMFFAPSTWFFRLVPGVPETGAFNAHWWRTAEPSSSPWESDC